jgi:hypothetical protein
VFLSEIIGEYHTGSQFIRCRCYSVSQVAEYCKIYRPDLLIGGEDYLLNAKELHGIGYIQNVIKPADQQVISQAEADLGLIKRLMSGVINTALALPGYKELGDRVGWIEPKFDGKLLTTRQWLNAHAPDLIIGKQSCKQLGVAFSKAYILAFNRLPKYGWTKRSNEYEEEAQQVLCKTFHDHVTLNLIGDY